MFSETEPDGHDQPRHIPAAQYIRMSTEHQQYSTENQAKVIAQYAEQRGYDVVASYEDGGKSGLTFGGRQSLQKLIKDVQDGQVPFKNILVYDVSRWGRFLDADESAYYEFICKRAGVGVHYCNEQFENDGSIQANVLRRRGIDGPRTQQRPRQRTEHIALETTKPLLRAPFPLATDDRRFGALPSIARSYASFASAAAAA